MAVLYLARSLWWGTNKDGTQVARGNYVISPKPLHRSSEKRDDGTVVRINWSPSLDLESDPDLYMEWCADFEAAIGLHLEPGEGPVKIEVRLL